MIARRTKMVARYAKFLARYPLAVLVCTIFVCASCLLSVFLITELPDFSNPIKGFETRGTEISQRSLALKNLRIDLDHLRGQNSIFHRYPDEYQLARNLSRQTPSTSRLFRRSSKNEDVRSRHFSMSRRIPRSKEAVNKTHPRKNKKLKEHEVDAHKPLGYCNTTPGQSSFGDDYAVLAFETTGGSDLLSVSVLDGLCDVEQRLWTTSVKSVDGTNGEDGMADVMPRHSCQLATKRRCCQPWHLASVTAHLLGKDDCTQLNESDVHWMKSRIDYCKGFASTLARCWTVGELECLKSVPANCSSQAMNLLYQYILPREYADPEPSNVDPSVTLMILPVAKDAYKELTLTQVERLPAFLSRDHIRLVAMDLGVRDVIFEQYLLKDTIFGIIALVLVFSTMWIYSGSFVFTLTAMVGINLSLGLAYFVYRLVFAMEFFPFMNLLTYVLIVGVGADDAFIFRSAWMKAKFDKNSGTHAKILSDTLSHAAVSMFVTSLTTAAAFYTNIFSHIVVVKCFGIFAGTTILTNYLLVITWLPACVVLSEKRPIFSSSYCWCCPRWCIRQQRRHPQEQEKPRSISIDRRHSSGIGIDVATFPVPDAGNHDPPRGKRDAEDGNAPGNRRNTGHWNTRKLSTLVSNPAQRVYHELSVVGRVFFQKLLPWLVIKLRLLWLLIFGVIAVLASVAVFYSPALKLPSKEYYQYFKSSHPFERWENDVKGRFRFASDNVRVPLVMYVVWGLRPTTDSRIFDPDDTGTLQAWSGRSGDLFDNVNLLWLRDFCSSMAVQNFTRFQPSEMPMLASCFVEDFMTTMRQRPCSHPVTGQSQRPCCADVTFPYPPGVFETCLKQFVSLGRSTITLFDLTSSSGPSGPLFSSATGKPSGLVIMFTSRYNFSFSYSLMNEFYESANKWVDDRLKSGPSAVRNGWLIADHLQLYDLQQALTSGTRTSVIIALAIAFGVLFITTWNPLISFLAVLSISSVIVTTIALLILMDWELNVLESTIIILTIGLSFDFTLHYGVAYRLCTSADDRESRVVFALGEVGCPVFMAFVTTFLAGAAMLPSTTLAYFQIGLFMILETTISWLYATFFFSSLLHLVGPSGNTCQINFRNLCAKKPVGSGGSSISGTTGRRVSRDIATEAALAAAARRKKSSIVSFNAVAFSTIASPMPTHGNSKMNALTALDYNRLDVRRSLADSSKGDHTKKDDVNYLDRRDSAIVEEEPTSGSDCRPNKENVEDREQPLLAEETSVKADEEDERQRLRRDSDEIPAVISEIPMATKELFKKPSLKERAATVLHRFSLRKLPNSRATAIEMNEDKTKLYRRCSDSSSNINRQSHQDVPFIDGDSSAHTICPQAQPALDDLPEIET